MTEIYADIVFPLKGGVYSYRVGDALMESIQVGRCVKVQLGRGGRKLYVGIVWRLYKERPAYKTIKSIDEYIDNAPVLSELQMRFWEWMAEYYMCSIGEVMKTALPSALKPSGFSDSEFEKDQYKVPTERYVVLHSSIETEQQLAEKIEGLRRAKKQQEALVEFCDKAGDDLFGAEVVGRFLSAKPQILRALEQKDIVEIVVRELEQDELPKLDMKRLPKLTELQEMALESIKKQFEQKDVVLLHGVTGSGKTEIYINLIAEELAKGKNVLYLLPEIAMTTQLVERVKRYFGERVIAYHSSFNERRRVESFRRANRAQGGELIFGVRSALFLPKQNIGLIVVDEEHDQSYKNQDFAPRYNARDSAVMLAYIGGAKTLMGSATPSLESYANTVAEKYGMVVIKERYGGVKMPNIVVSDTIRAVKRGERRAHFNKVLLDGIEQRLASEEQVMLFQNRRGFSPYVECGECGWVGACPHCSVSLTLHKGEGALKCHYCGYAVQVPTVCPSCESSDIQMRGFGTEKVEEELQKIFPEAKIERLDRDTARTMGRFKAIIDSFEQGQTDILVGTQMITKGFDFDGVSLVGVLNADNLLAHSDFRASERAYQMMTQVAGRSGRREKQGEVVIQTSQPNNQVIKRVVEQDYEGMAREQLKEREEFFYPPYCKIIQISLKHTDKELLWRAAVALGESLRGVFGRRVLGPQPPVVEKIMREYYMNFIIKVERGESFARAKKIVQNKVEEIVTKKLYRYIVVEYNVDP